MGGDAICPFPLRVLQCLCSELIKSALDSQCYYI